MKNMFDEPLDLTKEFKNMEPEWRIAAVIHDGNWYDKAKWRRVAKVPMNMLEEWIEKNDDILIKSDEGASFRVNYDEVIRWYAEEGLSTDTKLIPKNFPPKLWGGMTEAEAFISAPRRRTGTLTITPYNDEILEKCRQALKGTAKIYPDKVDKYKAFGLSSVHMKQTLSRSLTEKEFNALDIKTRAILMQRELVDFPQNWLEDALLFYVKYARAILEPMYSTLSIYLPEHGDIQAQIITWVIAAMKKFDETKPVPFSGYLSSVLMHWPYDLPDEYLGKELANFQRQRKRAVDEAQAGEWEGKNVPVSVLSDIMGITVEEYVELNNRHETWLAERNAETLTWEDSANEKAGTSVGYSEPVKRDIKKLNRISQAAIMAAIESADWDSAYALIDEIDSDNISKTLSEDLSDEYLELFAEAFEVIGG